MKLTVGAKVRFLNDVGGGIVSKIEKDLVYVINQDEFEVPVIPTECVVVEEASVEPIKEKKDIEPKVVTDETEEEVDIIEGNEDPRVYFAFVPQNINDIENSKYTLYIINDCNYHIVFSISYLINKVGNYFEHGSLAPNTKLSYPDVDASLFKEFKTFRFQILFYKHAEFKPVNPIDKLFYVIPEKFFDKSLYGENAFFDEASMVIALHKENKPTKSYNDKAEIEKALHEKLYSEKLNKSNDKKYKSPRAKEKVMEVDLHINKLLDTVAGMTNTDILNHQMNYFHLKMNEAVKNRVSKVVFIHGIGNGTLKNEIRRVLNKDYKAYRFEDASFKEYGFGATVVFVS